MRRNAGTDAGPSNTFTDGNPNTSTPASVLGSDWLNILQEEVAGLIEAAGLVIDQAEPFASNDKTQLLQAIQTLASGGGGGGGFKWTENPGDAPMPMNEYGENVFVFSPGSPGTALLVAYLKVPQGYQEGKQIRMYNNLYSTVGTGTMLLKTLATLIKKNTDVINTTTNQHASTNLALTNATPLQLRETNMDLTDADGEINGEAVEPGDLLKIEIHRDTDLDTTDIRFIPNATEVKFA